MNWFEIWSFHAVCQVNSKLAQLIFDNFKEKVFFCNFKPLRFRNLQLISASVRVGPSSAIAPIDFEKVEIDSTTRFLVLNLKYVRAFRTKTVQSVTFSTTEFKILREALLVMETFFERTYVLI